MEEGFTKGMYGLQFEPLQLFTSPQGVNVSKPDEIKTRFVKEAFANIDWEETTSYLQKPEVY